MWAWSSRIARLNGTAPSDPTLSACPIRSQVGILVNAFEQFTRLYFQSPSDLADICKADILATAFNSSDIGRVKSRQLS